jgi:hypothetical protein
VSASVVSMDLLRGLVADLRPVRRPARVLYAGAAFWFASALVHLVVLALDGWEFSGAVSFRKPMLFSFSFGLLMATVGWVLDRLPDRPRLAGPLAWTLLLSSTAEVGLISMQAWRGRASHFNSLQRGDEMIFVAMAVAIAFVSLSLLVVLVWALVERPGDRLVATAVIGGLLLVMTSLGIGQWIIELGTSYVDTHDAVPDTVVSGEAGVAKFPHAVALHGIQTFILAAVTLRRTRLSEATRRRVLRLIVGSYAAALAFTCAQTMLGHAPLAPTVWSAGLAVSVLAVTAGFARIGLALGRTINERPAPLPAA